MKTAILVGNPNSGKTTLFNALTGLSARVGNYPGITVEHREGGVDLGDKKTLRLIDLPGTYSLSPRSDDEVVAVRGVLGRLPETPAADLVIVVVDATALERNLYLTAQLRELPLPVVVALTMMDTVAGDGLDFDVAMLERRLGVPVIAAPAVKNGTDALKKKLRSLVDAGVHRPLALNPAWAKVNDDVTAAGKALVRALSQPAQNLVGSEVALGLLAAQASAMGTLDKLELPVDAQRTAHAIDRPDVVAQKAVAARYARVAGWVDGVVGKRASELPSVRFTRRVDAVLLHRVLGPVALVGVFLLLFQTLFSWSKPVMDGISHGMDALGALVSALVPASLPLLKSLLVNGVIKGVGNVVVFVPQIAALFLFLTLLEDSGYLARAAFILDRVMARVGLHGRAFVPLLSGFACAVPAILATRTIESTKDRIVTIMVTPLISCSARLPVYALIIACVFSSGPPLLGVIAPGAIVMIAMYALSIGTSIAMAAVFKRTLLKSPTPPLVLELPPYRVPKPGAVARAVLSRVKIFLTEAGTVILAITVVLWALFTFPRDDSIEQARAGGIAAVLATTQPGPARDQQLHQVDAKAAGLQVEQSVAGRLGHALEPVLSPLGFDWKLNVGIIASFAAREVLVSTLGLVYGLGAGDDDDDGPPLSLRDAMMADHHADGSPLYTPLVGLSLLVFFVLAMQCMSTLATVRRETQSWRWPIIQFSYMSVLAYVGSLVVYQGGKLLGFQ
ncbi:MAG TPA: ferrous iron transport protein B [Myxococcota bacterium]